MRMTKHYLAAQYIWKQGETTTIERLPNPLFSSELSEEGHAGVPALLLSHALMVACSQFLQ